MKRSPHFGGSAGGAASGCGKISLRLLLTCLVAVFAAGPAHAAFHLWSVTEVYSSPDGSVQFVKLATASTGENALNTHTISASGPLGTHVFQFPANLPALPTANKTFLIGTSNLLAIPGGVRPDYFFTNQQPFLFVNGGGAVTVGIGGSQTTPAVYTNLPTDGVSSLTGAGSAFSPATNAPKNFSGQAGSILFPQFQSTAFDGVNFSASFPTKTSPSGNPSYVIEFNDNLTSSNWQTLTTVSGDGTVKSLSNDVTSSGARVFRLRVPLSP